MLHNSNLPSKSKPFRSDDTPKSISDTGEQMFSFASPGNRQAGI